MITIKCVSFYFFLFLCCVSCTKMNDLHDVYLKRGETIYASRMDSVAVYSGYNRVKLRYWLKDRQAKYVLVYWNLRKDSVIAEIDNAGTAWRDLYIEHLDEMDYNFEILALNENKSQRSMVYEVAARVYGATFEGRLQNRFLEYAFAEEDSSKISLSWDSRPPYAVVTEIVTVENGKNVIQEVLSVDEGRSSIDYTDKQLYYRTGFILDSTSVDTVYSLLEPMVVLQPLSKPFSNWRDKESPVGTGASRPIGHPLPNNNSSGANHIGYLWDKTIGNRNQSPQNNWFFSNFEDNFTIDLKQTCNLKLLRTNASFVSSHFYAVRHPKKFRIYGSATTDFTADYSTWTFMGEFNSSKPSGAPVGTVTEEDWKYAWVDGELFVFADNLPPVRYIRIQVVDTYSRLVGEPAPRCAYSEISFWKQQGSN